MLERCQLEPLRPDQCQRQQPGTGTGRRPPPPTICTGMHPAQQIAPPPWPFSFAHLPALPPARPAGSAARHALGVAPPRGKAGKYPGSAGRSTRILRPPPAPGRISTASAAPMTPQPISCTACPLPTASSQQRQTSQQPAPAACTYQQHQRTPQPCRLPAAADQHHPRPPNGPKPAHRGPLPEGSDSLPDRHIDFAV